MNAPAAYAVTTPIPVQLSETHFTEFSLPHLSMSKRGPKCKLGYHRLVNLILWVLHTGMPWKCLLMPKDATGTPELHYTNVYRAFVKWADDGSLQQAFIATAGHLSDEKKLDVRILHGDGTNTVPHGSRQRAGHGPAARGSQRREEGGQNGRGGPSRSLSES